MFYLRSGFLCLVLFFAFRSFAQPLDVLVSSRGTNTIVLFNENGSYVADLVPSGSGGLSGPEDILFHPDGTILVTGFNNTAIKRYDGITGAYIGDFSSGYALNTPSKMSIGPDSFIYVTQWGTTQNKVVRFDLQGNFVDEFTDVGAPKGLGHLWDADRNFYVAEFGPVGLQGSVHKFDSTGADLGVFINTTVLDGPTSMWWDDNGDMLIEDWNQGKVLRFDPTGLFLGDFAAGMTNPEGLAFLPNGDILMGDWGEDAVHRLDSFGNLLGYFCSAGLIDPNCVKVRPGVTSVREVSKPQMVITPTTGRSFNISVPAGIHGCSISIFNSTGQLIARMGARDQQIWDAATVPAGIYIVECRSEAGTMVEKLVVSDH